MVVCPLARGWRVPAPIIPVGRPCRNAAPAAQFWPWADRDWFDRLAPPNQLYSPPPDIESRVIREVRWRMRAGADTAERRTNSGNPEHIHYPSYYETPVRSAEQGAVEQKVVTDALGEAAATRPSQTGFHLPERILKRASNRVAACNPRTPMPAGRPKCTEAHPRSANCGRSSAHWSQPRHEPTDLPNCALLDDWQAGRTARPG